MFCFTANRYGDMPVSYTHLDVYKRQETGIVEQGLYVVKGSVNPFYADKNGVSHEDVEVLKKALATIFENDESCARPAGSMAVCRLYWFEQQENHACVPVHNIFDLLDIQNQGSGYVCCLKELPDGVRVTELI